MTPDEFQALLREADVNLRRVLISLRLTGCWPGEARKLIWEWVDLDRALWILPDHKTVTQQRESRPRVVPLPVPILKGLRQKTSGIFEAWIGAEIQHPAQATCYSSTRRVDMRACAVE